MSDTKTGRQIPWEALDEPDEELPVNDIVVTADACWAFSPLIGYVCCLRRGHDGHHRAATKERIVAEWGRS